MLGDQNFAEPNLENEEIPMRPNLLFLKEKIRPSSTGLATGYPEAKPPFYWRIAFYVNY